MHTLYKILLLTSLILLLQFDYIPNTTFSFACKDPKLSQIYESDTVSGRQLLISAFFGPLIIIASVEVLKENSFRKLNGRTVRKFYKKCVIGTAYVILLTELLKSLVKEPRPHFLNTCKPDTNEACQEGALIFEFNCTNIELKEIHKSDLTRSFPSGHTSISVFVGLYCSYLVLVRLPSDRRSILLKIVFVVVCLGWTLLCSVSRVIDKRHHWWDVLAGAVLGMCYAFYTIYLADKKDQLCDKSNCMTDDMLNTSEFPVKRKNSLGDNANA